MKAGTEKLLFGVGATTLALWIVVAILIIAGSYWIGPGFDFSFPCCPE